MQLLSNKYVYIQVLHVCICTYMCIPFASSLEYILPEVAFVGIEHALAPLPVYAKKSIPHNHKVVE